MENLKQQTDQVLVQRYISGDNEAFDCLLERHQDRLYNYIHFTLRNPDLTEDFFQETFVKAIMTLKQGGYTESGKFFPWLTRIAHNLIIDYYRQENHMSVSHREETELDLLQDQDPIANHTEADMVNAQTLKDVKRLMNHLPDSQREVVFMRYYQDLSFKEIAEITGVSINTSLGRMRYALMNMRRMAKEHGISLEWV